MKISLFVRRLFMALLVLTVTGSFVTMSYAYFDTLQDVADENIPLGEWRNDCSNNITTAQEFFDFATSSTSSSTDYYCLQNDIDFSGFTWTHTGAYDTNQFKGTFDGQGYTLSNITMTATDTSTTYMSLFSRMDGGTIKNVKIDNFGMGFTTTFHNSVTYQSAIFAAEVTGVNNVFENITITNSEVIANSLAGAGGLVGQAEANADIDIKNIKVTGLTVLNNSKRAGGLISRAIKGTGTITIADVDFEGNVATNNATSNTGGIIGTVQNMTINFNRTIVEYTSIGTVNLSNGSISYTSSKYVGGFIGNTQTGSVITFTDTFFTGELQTTYANLGSLIGRRKATPTTNTSYYSNALFASSNTPTTSTGVLNATVVNATSMPSTTWWNTFKVNFDNANSLWTQDQTGRLTLIR